MPNPVRWNNIIRELAESKCDKPIPNGIVADKVAVIIEPRVSEILPNLLIWMVHLLVPHGWNFIVFHGTNNKDIIENWVIKHNVSNIFQLRNLQKENLTINDYNILLRSESFWESMPFENILIFQIDTVLLDAELDVFLEYDYVGAPWAMTQRWCSSPTRVGNGGLSLRKKSAMIRVIKNLPHNTNYNEDTFFSVIGAKYIHLPPLEIAMRFSVETTFFPTPKGMHKPWGFITPDELEILYTYMQTFIKK